MPKSLISQSTIKQIKNKVDEAAMPDTCSILSKIEVPDGKGGFTKTTTRTDNVPCRFTTLNLTSGNDQVTYEIAQRGGYRINIPTSYSVSAASQILYRGRYYDVVWTPPLTSYSTSRVIGLNDANQIGS